MQSSQRRLSERHAARGCAGEQYLSSPSHNSSKLSTASCEGPPARSAATQGEYFTLGQSKGQGREGQGRAGQGRAGQGRAEKGAAQCIEA